MRHAVTSGLQHLSFQPMLVNLPAPVPPDLNLLWSHVEDDEFVWRVFRRYGEDAVPDCHARRAASPLTNPLTMFCAL